MAGLRVRMEGSRPESAQLLSHRTHLGFRPSNATKKPTSFPSHKSGSHRNLMTRPSATALSANPCVCRGTDFCNFNRQPTINKRQSLGLRGRHHIHIFQGRVAGIRDVVARCRRNVNQHRRFEWTPWLALNESFAAPAQDHQCLFVLAGSVPPY